MQGNIRRISLFLALWALPVLLLGSKGLDWLFHSCPTACDCRPTSEPVQHPGNQKPQAKDQSAPQRQDEGTQAVICQPHLKALHQAAGPFLVLGAASVRLLPNTLPALLALKTAFRAFAPLARDCQWLRGQIQPNAP